ncbi:hypothetical protein AG0111_0g11657 [Alternaria gaisen]|uniref:Uncharacterized protein n=1 Tax=Alternaria gaisen TaxID=167740 RepID=A0ACB6F6V1_9PLEO|nr:hypothetical protein AG0111_0g11657 [Alternaria gaisen]
MATSIDLSRFRLAVQKNQAKAVPMNGFDSTIFSQTPCIGTDQLGSCSVVLIVSPQAAILGHVAPRPDGNDTDDPYARDNHVRSFMDRLITYYRQYQNFMGSPNSWVICAIFGPGIALPDQQKIMEEKLRDAGLSVDTSQTYRVPYNTDHLDRGSVFVDARSGTIQVYVENRIIRSIAATSPSLGSAPADSRWDGQYYVSIQNPAYVWINGAWAIRPSTASGSTPADSRWDGQYYVSTQNPAYVWINGAWAIRP